MVEVLIVISTKSKISNGPLDVDDGSILHPVIDKRIDDIYSQIIDVLDKEGLLGMKNSNGDLAYDYEGTEFSYTSRSFVLRWTFPSTEKGRQGVVALVRGLANTFDVLKDQGFGWEISISE